MEIKSTCKVCNGPKLFYMGHPVIIKGWVWFADRHDCACGVTHTGLSKEAWKTLDEFPADAKRQPEKFQGVLPWA